MKSQFIFFCFLVLAVGRISSESPSSSNAPPQQKEDSSHRPTEDPPARKNQLLSTMPFTNDLSTQPLASHPPNPMQNGFGNMFGFGGAHNPNMPTFSMDPMMSLGPQMGMGHPLFGSPAQPSTPYFRNPNSVTHRVDDDMGFYNSLSAAAYPELRVRKQCESVQRQAIGVANNLVKRQNKMIFKELMDYILKSKFLMGMTEVKINKVLKEKFTSLMKRYTLLTEDNVKLISSSDDEMMNLDTDDLDEELKPPGRVRPTIVDEEDEYDENAGRPSDDGLRSDTVSDDDFLKLIDSLKDSNSTLIVNSGKDRPTTIEVKSNTDPTPVKPTTPDGTIVTPPNNDKNPPVVPPEPTPKKPWWKFWKKNMQFLKKQKI